MGGCNKTRFLCLVFILGLFTPWSKVWAERCPPNGNCNISGIVNRYMEGKESVGAGSLVIPVTRNAAGTPPYTSFDFVLVIQMQDASIDSSNSTNYGGGHGNATGYLDLNNAGVFEFVQISSITPRDAVSDNIFLHTPLQNSYAVQAGSTSQRKRSFQVVTVKTCERITLIGNVTCKSWDGHTGGILLLKAIEGIDVGNYEISCSSNGFRGAKSFRTQSYSDYSEDATYVTVFSDVQLHALKGEGIAGTSTRTVGYLTAGTDPEGYPGGDYACGSPGNAGGGGNHHNAGGGGGSLGGNGGNGGVTFRDKKDYGGRGAMAIHDVTWPSRLFLGGGGGSGQVEKDNGEGSGGNGGGLIVLESPQISGALKMYANGEKGHDSANDGAGGGGGGGFIALLSPTSLTLSDVAEYEISANGGDGGTSIGVSYQLHPAGGAGGGGIFVTTLVANIPTLQSFVSVNGGLNTSQENSGYLPGSPGEDGVIVPAISYNSYFGGLFCTESPSRTPTSSPSFTSTHSPSPPPSISVSPTTSASFSPSSFPSGTRTPGPSISQTSLPSTSATVTRSISSSETPTPPLSSSVTPRASESPSMSATNSITPSPSNIIRVIPTPTATPLPSIDIAPSIPVAPSSSQNRRPTLLISQPVPTPSRNNVLPVISYEQVEYEGTIITFTELPDDVVLVIEGPSQDFVRDDITSNIIDLTLYGPNGEIVQPIGMVEICLEVRKSDDNCLAYYDDVESKWVCEDSCLDYSDDKRQCGMTSHFTNFAVVLGGVRGSDGECSSFSDWILNAGWQDAILLGACTGFCCCFILLVVVFSTMKRAMEPKKANSGFTIVDNTN